MVFSATSVDVVEVINQRTKQHTSPAVEEAAGNALTVWQLPSCYMKLSKSRLTGWQYSVL